jgi:hypothetical protein
VCGPAKAVPWYKASEPRLPELAHSADLDREDLWILARTRQPTHIASPGLTSWEILSRPWRDCSWLSCIPRTASWATLSRPCGTVSLQEQIDPVECFCYPKADLGDSANAIVGAAPPSFSALVRPTARSTASRDRFGDLGHPPYPFGPCYDTHCCGT